MNAGCQRISCQRISCQRISCQRIRCQRVSDDKRISNDTIGTVE